MNPQQVIDEERPMLNDVLGRIGLLPSGKPVAFEHLLQPLGTWLEQQHIADEDRPFVASVIGAFVSQYLIECKHAVRRIVDGRIVLRVPVQAGVVREFEPYAFGLGLANEPRNAVQSLKLACGAE